jgi:uncharacterized protein (DUF58 family)
LLLLKKARRMSNLFHASNTAGDLNLLLEAEKVAHSFMKGVHGRRRVGAGEAFWQFRPWQPGDARRDIDWRQSAKRDGAFVRQTEWEAAQTVWLYRDATESMEFTSSPHRHAALLVAASMDPATSAGWRVSKKNYAEILLLALGIILLNGGEQVGLLGTSLAPQTGYPSVQRLFEALPSQKQLSDAARPVAARSHVMLISDFYYPVEELELFCEKLAARHVTGTLVQVFDPAEAALPYHGRVKFEDVESADALDVAQVDAIRTEYIEKFTAHQKALDALAHSFGWTFEKFGTDVKPEAALLRMYEGLANK